MTVGIEPNVAVPFEMVGDHRTRVRRAGRIRLLVRLLSEQPHGPQLAPGSLVVVSLGVGLPDFMHPHQLRAGDGVNALAS